MGNSKVVKKISFTHSCLVGIIVSAAITILLVCIGALFIQNEYISINSITIIGMIIEFIAAFFGLFLTGKMQKGREEAAMGITAGAYCTLLLCVGMLLFDGLSVAFFGGLTAVTGAYVMTLFLLKSTKNRQNHKRKNRRYR